MTTHSCNIVGCPYHAPADHEPDVEYVPVCFICGRAVELTEADDGTFRHVGDGQHD